MKGYKTTPCVICGKVHDTAANCPSHQALCSVCQKLVVNQTEKSS